ncbi:MAG: hypothetical protein R6V50_04355 [Thermoplasmatota archaeon]
MVDESLEDLIQKKDEFQEKANKCKKKRDLLHIESREMAKERDDINARVRQLRNQINEHKRKRDEYNERVKHAKEQRNEIIKNHISIKKQIKEFEREKASSLGINLNQLKLSLRKLETEQMTQPMSAQKEKKLIETIKDIHLKIKEQEKALKKDPKLTKALEEEKQFKQKAEKQHALVEKLAKKAQEEHQVMIEMLGQLDNYVKKTTAIQEKIVLTKIDADKIHKEFIEYVNNIHDLEKTISGTEKKKIVTKKIADASAAQKKADVILEKFKKGEKLSTEDLMILQKAGLL